VQMLGIEARDAQGWGPRADFEVRTNLAPIVSVADQTIGPDLWLYLNDIIEITDTPDDEVKAYHLWDSEGGDNWWIAGIGFVDASSGYRTTSLDAVWAQGDPMPGNQTLWVAVEDGCDLSIWESFAFTTIGDI